MNTSTVSNAAKMPVRNKFRCGFCPIYLSITPWRDISRFPHTANLHQEISVHFNKIPDGRHIGAARRSVAGRNYG
jgi:hypothetical protein